MMEFFKIWPEKIKKTIGVMMEFKIWLKKSRRSSEIYHSERTCCVFKFIAEHPSRLMETVLRPG
jgi:hypothetical protein